MEDHQPTTIALDEYAGVESRAAVGLAVLEAARGLRCPKNPGDVTFDFDRGLRHRDGQRV